MSIFIWNSEIKNAYIWTTPVKEIYVGTTKVRPNISFEDNFSWTSLNTTYWKSNHYWSEWSLSVNNGLTISCGSSNYTTYLKSWYTISTQSLFTWNENIITAEVTYTWYSWIRYDGWSFSILWNECRDGVWVMDSVTWAIYSTWWWRWYALSYYKPEWQADFISSNRTFSNPTTVKVVLNRTSDVACLYINWTLYCTKNSILCSWMSWNNYIWKPLLTISPRYSNWALTIYISKVKLTVS